MKPILAVFVASTLALGAAWGQSESIRIYTNPRPIPREVLDRLRLKLAWDLRISTHGVRDGIYSIQLLPPVGQKNPLLLVQTLRGAAIALDAETGDVFWRTQAGPEYVPMQPAGYNSTTIFLARRDRLHALDRETGMEVLYDVERYSYLPVWGMQLDGIPSAGLAASDEVLHVCTGRRVSAYYLPVFAPPKKLGAAEPLPSGKRLPSPQPELIWTLVLAPLYFEQRPLEAREILGLVASDGTLVGMNKFEGKDTYRYQFPQAVEGRVAQYHNFAYVPSRDSYLYALDLDRGQLAWRFPGTAPIVQPVYATERDVWVYPNRAGLYRVDRQTGAGRWGQVDGERFLATNQQFVYATDRHGNLLVLDYERGSKLAKYDIRDWNVHASNELNDRIYLAAHDGQIQCLHNRDNIKPLALWQPMVMGPKVKEQPKLKLPPIKLPGIQLPEVKKIPEVVPPDVKKDDDKKPPEVKKDPDVKPPDDKKDVEVLPPGKKKDADVVPPDMKKGDDKKLPEMVLKLPSLPRRERLGVRGRRLAALFPSPQLLRPEEPSQQRLATLRRSVKKRFHEASLTAVVTASTGSEALQAACVRRAQVEL